MDDKLARPLGRYVGASVWCHGLVWSRSGYNVMENAVVGMHNTVFVVKLIVDISCDNGTLHSLFKMCL